MAARQPCADVATAAANRRVSAWGAWVNHLEPVALWAALVAFGPRRLPPLAHALAAVYAAVAVAVTARMTARCTEPSRESAPHLHWRWNEDHGTRRDTWPFYALFLATSVALMLWGLPPPQGTTVAALTTASLAASWLVYSDKHAVGAMWCFAATAMPWLLLAIL